MIWVIRRLTTNKGNVNVSCTVNKRDVRVQNLDRINPMLR